MSVVQLLQQAIAQIAGMYVLAAQILGSLVTSGWYLVVRDAANVTQDIHDILDDPTCGQAAQCSKLDSLLADVATLASDIAALGNPQQSTLPVILPATPPAGYGGATTSALAAAVWNTPNYAGQAMGDTMRSVVYFLDGVNSNLSFPSPTGGPFRISANLGPFNTEPWLFTPDYGLDSILPTDATVGDWLNRVHGRGETWTQDPDSLYWRTFGLGSPLNNTTWYCTLSQVQFDQIKREMAGSTINVPPVWPGLANVTLGAAHAMVPPGESITEDCDGVIIAVTGVPSWAGSFQFGTATSWRNVGAVTFTSDNGQQEFAQTFGWTSGVFCPKAMNHAAGFAYRAAVGVSGTITPFTINS